MAGAPSIETCDLELAFDGYLGLLVHAGEVEFGQVEFGGGGAGGADDGGQFVWFAEVVDGVVGRGLGVDAAGFLVLDDEVGEV